MLHFEFDETLINKWRFRKDMPTRQRIYELMATMLEAGVPIIETLTELRRVRISLSNDKHLEVKAYNDWIDRIGHGETLKDAVLDWVPDDERQLIAAGEKSGKLPDTLRSILEIIEAKEKIQKSIKSALLYPTVLLLVVMGMLYAFAFLAIPFYLSIVPGASFSGLAGFIVDLAGGIQKYFFWGVLLIAMFIIGFGFSLSRWSDGDVRLFLDKKFLPMQIYRIINGSTWLKSFSALLAAGVPVMDALSFTSKTKSKWLNNRIQSIEENLGDVTIGAAMNKTGYDFPDMEIIGQIVIFSKFGSFSDALNTISDRWVKTSVETINAKMKTINSILILLVISIIVMLALGQADIINQVQQNLKA